MPDETITIGGKQFQVACQPGQESFLQGAAQLLDVEATALLSQVGRLPAEKMLLMAGLMLADKMAGRADQVRTLEDQVAALETQISTLQNRPVPMPERIEVPVVPQAVTDTLAELAARAEALADQLDDRPS